MGIEPGLNFSRPFLSRVLVITYKTIHNLVLSRVHALNHYYHHHHPEKKRRDEMKKFLVVLLGENLLLYERAYD